MKYQLNELFCGTKSKNHFVTLKRLKTTLFDSSAANKKKRTVYLLHLGQNEFKNQLL